MADLPIKRLKTHSPPFYHTSCDCFSPYYFKTSTNKKSKIYGVFFTCLNTRAVHLEMALDCSTMEFLQTLQRFFSLRGQPSLMMSDNGSQLVGAELKAMIEGRDQIKLEEFGAEKGMTWKFTTPTTPHHNGCVKSLVKSAKRAQKLAIGEPRSSSIRVCWSQQIY